jgi:hypothetical protein
MTPGDADWMQQENLATPSTPRVKDETKCASAGARLTQTTSQATRL